MVLIPLKEKLALVFLLFLLVVITHAKTKRFYKTSIRPIQLIQNRSIVNKSSRSIIKRSYVSNNDKQNLLKYIFSVVQFDKKECEYAFQNCLLDVNNVKNVSGYYSEQCFPFQKSLYCLDEMIFEESDCVYKLSEKIMKAHIYRMKKNLDQCIERFPSERQFANSNKTTPKWSGLTFHGFTLIVCYSFFHFIYI